MKLLESKLIINPFDGIDWPEESQQEQQIEKTIEAAVEEVRDAYLNLNPGNGSIETINKLLLPILTEVQINKFLHSLDKAKQKGTQLAFFLNRLVQDTYKAHNNGIQLIMSGIMLNFLGFELKAKPHKRLKLTIFGDAYNWFGANSEYCTMILNGNSRDNLGLKSENCSFTVNGDTSDGCGWSSNKSRYIIHGNTGNSYGGQARDCFFSIFGDAKNQHTYGSIDCTFEFHGKVGSISQGSAGCIFKASQIETYEAILRDLAINNTVQLIDNYGKVLEEKRK